MVTSIKNKNPSNTTEKTSLFLSILLVLTFYFNTQYADPFNAAKMVLLLIVATLTLPNILKSFRNANYKVSTQEKRLYFLLSFFIASLFFSAVISNFPLQAWLGDIQRKNGVLTYLSFCIIFVYVMKLSTFQISKIFIKFSVLIGLTLSIYGVMQLAGKDFVNWNNPHNPIILTFGNPNYASAALSVIASIGFLLMFQPAFSLKWRVFGFLSSVSCLFVVYKSNSRQGLIIFLIANLVFLYLFAMKFKPRFRAFSSVIFLAVSLVGLMGMMNKGFLAPYLYKQSLSVRGYYWRAAFEMFKDNPISGVGLDRYAYFFKEFREVNYVNTYGTVISSSDAHNVFLQLFSTGGIFVGLGYLLIIIFVLVACLHYLSKLNGNDFFLASLLFSSWTGYQAQSFISINNIGTAVWGWYLGGLIIGLALKNLSLTGGKIKTKSPEKSKSFIDPIPWIFTTIILIPVLTLTYHINKVEKLANSNRYFAESNPVENFRNFAVDSSNRIISNSFADDIYKLSAARTLVNYGEFEAGFKEIERLISNDPNFQPAIEYAAEARTLEGKITDAIEHREQIARIDPFNDVNLLKLIELNLMIANADRANEIYKILQERLPGSNQLSIAQKLLTEKS